MVYVAGKPAQLFDKLTANNSLHFVPIDHTPVLLETYLPTQLNSQDYPNLIEPNQTVKTIAVGAVLAVYNWKSASPRYQKTANFVNHFLRISMSFNSQLDIQSGAKSVYPPSFPVGHDLNPRRSGWSAKNKVARAQPANPVFVESKIRFH